MKICMSLVVLGSLVYYLSVILTHAAMVVGDSGHERVQKLPAIIAAQERSIHCSSHSGGELFISLSVCLTS